MTQDRHDTNRRLDRPLETPVYELVYTAVDAWEKECKYVFVPGQSLAEANSTRAFRVTCYDSLSVDSSTQRQLRRAVIRLSPKTDDEVFKDAKDD